MPEAGDRLAPLTQSWPVGKAGTLRRPSSPYVRDAREEMPQLPLPRSPAPLGLLGPGSADLSPAERRALGPSIHLPGLREPVLL